MQMIRMLAALALMGRSFLTDAVSLRRRGGNEPTVADIATLATSNALAMKVSDDVDYKVLNKTSIEKKDSVDCLCEMGSFWHWRIKACVKQGGWGYECGYFPKEHHHRVCQDGLKCELLDQSRVQYVHPGAVPGSCKPCLAADNCTKGKERHSADCMKEYKVAGSACQTVQVSVMATASATVTEKVTTSGTASAKAKATATEKATVKKDGQEASATKKAAAEGKATAKSKGTGKATAEATATEKGTANGKACFTVKEVKKLLGLQEVKSIGAVLSAQVVARGDKEAFDKAYAKALAAAQKAGLLNAEQAAEALASAEAREQAALEAVANANEAAAWKAEAGAKKDAQDKAKASAMGKAQSAASKEATAAAEAAAKAAADAKAAKEALKAASSGTAEEKAAAQAKSNAAARKATRAANAAAAAKAKEDAIAKAAAAEAAAAAAAKKQKDALKAQQDALSDVINGQPTAPPVKPKVPEPTNPPRKISKDQLEAKLP